MRYYSTRRNAPAADFREATIKGQPPGKGLYFPETIPFAGPAIAELSKEQLAFEIIRPYVGDAIPPAALKRIVEETVCFDFPLVNIAEGVYALELFHGPTLAFKDVGARFMSRCLEYFVRNSGRRMMVLTATSGDTGGAVANGFYKSAGIDVVILYPSGKVSHVQELQLTTPGQNIHAVEVNGTFDDCQRLVKQAFADEALNRQLMLTSANSINIARWLPQQFYYWFAWQQWPYKDAPPVISVPSGNFGNISAGLLAARAGLPIAHFIAACNENDVVPRYFATGAYAPKPAVQTCSNAMDVGDPSNFERMLELFHADDSALKKVVSSCSISDQQTLTAIQEAYAEYAYVMDPHGAVGYAALRQYLDRHPGSRGLFLETAHPVKFETAAAPTAAMPPQVEELLRRKKHSVNMEADYATFEAYIKAL